VATIGHSPEHIEITTRGNRRVISEKKLLANRINALRSTGPKSKRGKQTVRQNAIKHGLSAQQISILPGEQVADFERYCSTFQQTHQPQNDSCATAVRNVTMTAWKLGRAYRMRGFSPEHINQRWPTLQRHTSALGSELRNQIRQLNARSSGTINGGTKEMSSDNRFWDLNKDGFLWKQAIRHRTDQEFRKQCEGLVEQLQQSADRRDWQQLILHDMRAAAYFIKCHVAEVQAAQTRIGEYHARENVQRAEPEIREDARLASTWANQDASDQATKGHTLCNREIFKSTELLMLLERSEEPASPEAKRPAVLEQVDRKPRRIK
jgi:hypothetical protein